ncbi:hypothetical protein ACYPKM_02425 [Pseudomonas aeruginosa]
MPRIAKDVFTHTGPDGTKESFETEIFVDSKGEFSCTVPEYLLPALQTIIKTLPASGNFSAGEHRGKFRAFSRTRDDLGDLVYKAMAEHYQVHVHSEQVLVYDWASNVSFWIEGNGDISPCGSCQARDAGGRWSEMKTTTPIHATGHVQHFSVGLYAAIYEKTTYTRPSGSNVQWRKLTHLSDRTNGPEAVRLSNFVGLQHHRDPSRLKTMPATEEACRFFADTLLQLCRMALAFDEFFKSEENVLAAITGKGPSLLAAPKA